MNADAPDPERPLEPVSGRDPRRCWRSSLRGARGGSMRATGRSAGGLGCRWPFVWLVFLPNSCYLLTEWRHYLDTLTQSPLFAEAHHSGDGRLDFFLITGFYLLYSGAGLLAFFLAVWPLDRLTRRRLGRFGASPCAL